MAVECDLDAAAQLARAAVAHAGHRALGELVGKLDAEESNQPINTDQCVDLDAIVPSENFHKKFAVNFAHVVVVFARCHRRRFLSGLLITLQN